MDTLHIRRHVVRWRVARGGGAHPVGSSLDTMLAERLAKVTLPREHEGVWLIRRLDVRSCIAVAWPPFRSARELMAATAAALERVLERGAVGDMVLWFPDRAAFLARFLVDCADGRTSGRWEYAEFDDACPAPSTTMRAAIDREPDTALEALVRLAHADLRRVLDRFEPTDAAAVLAALATVTVSDATDPAPLVVEALGRLLDRSVLPEEPQATALTVFLEVARQEGSAPPARTDRRAREVVRLMAVLRAGPSGEEEDPAQAMAGGPRRAFGAPGLSGVPEIVAWPAEARREAVSLLLRARSGEPERAGGPPSPLLATNLGGMFLLLPLLEGFPWQAMTAGWPDLDGIDGTRLAQFFAIVGALGAERSAAAAIDPVLRLALGLPADLGAPAISTWSREIEPDAVRRSIEAFIGGLSAEGKVSGVVTVAPSRDGVVAVDGARGIWLGTAASAPASIRNLLGSLGAALERPAAAMGSEPWIEACLPSGPPQPEPIDPRLLFRLDTQNRYCSLGPPFDLAPRMGNLFLLAAQALGRELAWRLPGFSRSSLPYLSDNVLSFAATVDVEPARFVVRVGDPPLHLLLSMAGLNRRRFHLDATGDREWVLTQDR